MPRAGVKVDVRKLHAALLALVAAVLLLGAPRAARACGNAVFIDLDKRVSILMEAQAALDENDLETARELAQEVLTDSELADERGPKLEWALDRARRIVALSYVRDFDVTAPQIVEAQEMLRGRLHDPRRTRDPSMEADYAEAEGRIAHLQDSAYDTLKRLHAQDLVGSPHALGTLNRIARAKHDSATAAKAYDTCAKMIGPSVVCEGRYESGPLLRGRPSGYAIPGSLFAAALAFRLLRLRRKKRPDAPLKPWIGYARRVQTFAVAIAGFYLFARPTSPIATSLVVATILALTFFAEKRGFFAALRRGSIPGFVVRPTIPDDAHLVSIGAFTGSKHDETVERVYDDGEAGPGYRDPSRIPLFRLVAHHRLPAGVGAAVVVAAIFALALLAASTLVLRGAS